MQEDANSRQPSPEVGVVEREIEKTAVPLLPNGGSDSYAGTGDDEEKTAPKVLIVGTFACIVVDPQSSYITGYHMAWGIRCLRDTHPSSLPSSYWHNWRDSAWRRI